jgi:multidrug resistance efflux pump
MKRVAIIISVIAFLALIVFLFLGNQSVSGALQQKGQKRVQPSASPAATRAPTGAPVIGRNDQVTAACKLVPISSVNLSFNTPGLVAEVLVAEGDKVGKGQLLAHLSNQEEAQASITSANLDLINAQQALTTLYNEAPLKAAEALQALAKAPEDVQDAQSKVSGLETRFSNQAEIDAAHANLIFAQNKLENAQDAYRPYSNKNETSLMRAKTLSDLSQAQKEYDAALRKYNSFFTAPSETSVSKAEADLALARVQQEDAQRKYEILKNGPDPDEIALAQARISNAEAQLAAAQSTLANMELRAPFTGTIATVDLKPGAYVSPGADVLLLVDDSDWRVETTDLTELNVVRIREGNPVNITFDALPDIKFEGNVLKISSLGENRQGDITYRVETNLKGFDKRLKWNMTCSITVQTR